MIKNIATAVIWGAATTLGAYLMDKACHALENPVNKAKVKKFFGGIKKQFDFKKDDNCVCFEFGES